MVVLSSLPPPEEGIVHKQENTQAHVQGRGCLGNGTLFIAESRLSWRGEAGEGFSLEYPAISLHAISRDLNAFPQPCLYLMLDTDLEQNSAGSSSDDEEENKVSEMRFVPQDPAALERMYQAMSDCQLLHPDPDDSGLSEEEGNLEEGQGDYYDNPEGAEHLTPDGQQTLERLEAAFNAAETQHTETNGTGDTEMETGGDQFEDAEMER